MSAQVFNMQDIASVSQLIQDGAIGIIPTDTVYGLVCSAAQPAAVARLYALKHREHKPGTIIAANIEQLEQLGIKHKYLKAVEQFWPNPISVLVPCDESLGYLHLGKFSLACRIPKDPKLRALLEKTGALLSTSANKPRQETAQTTQEAREIFGNNVSFYVDGGDNKHHQPSTIIRIVDDAIEVIREGAVKIDENGRMYT